MRYIIYLIISLIMQVVAWVITPILPIFSVYRYGPLNNNNGYGMGWRLPKWLSWFDTPDNPLTGDERWKSKHWPPTHWSMVLWLYRNSLYGFKWTVLGAPMPDIENKYWQWRYYSNWIKLDFGWLLEPYKNNPDLYYEQPKALFQFSIRPRF